MTLRRLITVGIALAALTSCRASADVCDRQRSVPRSECAALRAFYESTDGPGWKDQRGWLTTEQVCDWHGVVCTSGHVTAISLNYNELTGSLPAQIGDLPELHTLSGYFNHLAGPLPPELAEASHLQRVILHDNLLEGSLPPEWGGLTELEQIDLGNNQLSGPIPEFLGRHAKLA